MRRKNSYSYGRKTFPKKKSFKYRDEQDLEFKDKKKYKKAKFDKKQDGKLKMSFRFNLD